MPRSRRAAPPREPLVTKRERILSFASANPTATLREIAIACDCSAGYVDHVKQLKLHGQTRNQKTASSINGKNNGTAWSRKLFTKPNHDLRRRRKTLGKLPPMTQDEIQRLVDASSVEVTRCEPGVHYGWKPSWA